MKRIPFILIFILGVWSTVCLIKELYPSLTDSSGVMSFIIWAFLTGWAVGVSNKNKKSC